MVSSLDFTKDLRFKRTFVLAADPTRGRNKPFTITYADYGYHNEGQPEPGTENVLLFFSPMWASRLIHITKDTLAKRHRVRVINPDRPGFGATDAVDPDQRIALWRDAIPALLSHLGIKHVSLGCHSAGTIYAVDVLLHHPEILHPSRPYLAIGGPWVLPVHTGRQILSMAQLLPSYIIRQTDKLARLVNDYVGPAIGRSIGVSQALVARVRKSEMKEQSISQEEIEAKEEEDQRPFIFDQAYVEGVEGVSSELLIVLQKTTTRASEGDGWGDWGDYDRLVPLLAEVLRKEGRRLQVDVFYAEEDFLIGDGMSKGAQWFDQCWGEQNGRRVIDYRSQVISGANHDSIWDLRHGVMHRVLTRMDQSLEKSRNEITNAIGVESGECN